MDSKQQILGKLRQARQPFTDRPPVNERRHMSPLDDHSPAALRTRFIAEAEALSCAVYPVSGEGETLATLLGLLEDGGPVSMWDEDRLPVEGLADVLRGQDIEIAPPGDHHARSGVTAVDAALAATGSLVLCSGPGQHRQVSLLPDIHIALVRASQIVADLETWVHKQRETDAPAFRRSSNTVIISGPSKTADIGQELIKGAHGPRYVHIILQDGI